MEASLGLGFRVSGFRTHTRTRQGVMSRALGFYSHNTDDPGEVSGVVCV